MASVQAYLLSVTAASVFCALIRRMQMGKGTGQKICVMLTGIFMVLTVLGPMTDISFSDLGDFSVGISQQVQDAVADGEAAAGKALSARISDSLVAYIQNKASAMDAHLEVRVELTDAAIPMPSKVYIRGNVSPYTKRKLQNMIRDDLGVDKENQVWT